MIYYTQYVVPQPLVGQPQQQQHGQQQQPSQQPQTSLQQQYIQQFPGQQVHNVLATGQPLLGNARQPHYSGQQQQQQYSPQQQQQQNAHYQQDMIPIPQVQPISTNNVYFNMQTQFRASNPPTVTQPTTQPQQILQLPSQPQFMIVQQQPQQQQPQQQQPQRPQQQQSQQQQFTSNEQYAVVPPQYLNTSLQQLRQVQQPRYVQQQVHQQRLNNQYQLAPHGHQAPDSLSIDSARDNSKGGNISTPDVISIILGSPNTTPMLKRGDKVGDPFSSTTVKEESPMVRFNQGHHNTEQQVLDRQHLDRQHHHQLDRQLSTEDWLSANMPQDLLTPDTANMPKLMTPGGDNVFEFSNEHLFNANMFNLPPDNHQNSNMFSLGNPATSQPGVAR